MTDRTKELFAEFLDSFFSDLSEADHPAPEIPVTDEATTFDTEGASEYLHSVPRNLTIYRRYGLIRYAKMGRGFVYRKEWLDDFLEAWAGYDLSSEVAVKQAINSKAWKEKHL